MLEYQVFFFCSVWLCRCSWYKFFLFNSLSPTPSCYLEVVWNEFGLTVRVLIQMLCFSATRLPYRSHWYIPWSFFLTCSCTSSDLTIKSSLSVGILLLDIITMICSEFNYLSDFKFLIFFTHLGDSLFPQQKQTWHKTSGYWEPQNCLLRGPFCLTEKFQDSNFFFLSRISVRPNSFWLLDNCSTIYELKTSEDTFTACKAK